MVMLVIRLISLFLICIFAYGFYTQIISPTINGTKLFPFFRSKHRNAMKRITDAKTEKHDSELMQKAIRAENNTLQYVIKSEDELVEEYDLMIDNTNKTRVEES